MVRRNQAKGIDIAASALLRVVPARFSQQIDQLRLDATSLFDGLAGVRTPPFSTHERPLPRPRALREIDPLRELLPERVATRYDVVTRDLRTVLGELRGDRLPFVVARPSRPLVATTRNTVASTRRSFVVRAIRHETSDAIAIDLAEDGAPSLTFSPGQFVTLWVRVDGVERKRAYSIASTPTDGQPLTIAVKRVDGGVVSGHLLRALRVGDTLLASGPHGTFVAPPSTSPRHLVLIAGGSGITPIVSIARATLEGEPGARVTLIYGNRAADDIIFGARLATLAAAHPERLRVVYLLERTEGTDATLMARRGRPDRTTVLDLVRELELERRWPGEDEPLFFVSGPARMMEAVRGALLEAGVAESRVREERFQSPPDAPSATQIATAPETAHQVSVKRRGALRTFRVEPGETILDAATRAGADLPSSCTMGGCGACRCRATEGDVDVEEPNCLSTAERDRGYVLTCVGRPRTDVTLELP